MTLKLYASAYFGGEKHYIKCTDLNQARAIIQYVEDNWVFDYQFCGGVERGITKAFPSVEILAKVEKVDISHGI